MTYPAYSGPSSSGLGRPGASRMEPTSSGVGIPPSGVLATGPPAMQSTSMRSEGYASQGFASQGYASLQGSGGPSLYAPQLSVPAQETVSMEAINTHETNTTLDNFPSVSGLQPVPYTGVDPPTPPQALSQLDLNNSLNATVWNAPSTQQSGFNQFGMDAQPPGTITTVAPGSMPAGSDPRFSGVVSFRSLPAQGGAPNYPAFAPQSSSVPPQMARFEVQTSGGLQETRAQEHTSARMLPQSISTVPDHPVHSRSRDVSPRVSSRESRRFEPMQSVPTKSG